MSQFHYSKVIATVGPSLAKETVLSKVINFVDVFRINLSQGFIDHHKKYIDTILKLDNSKTIMLETKGAEIRSKNVHNMTFKKNDKIIIDFSEYQEEEKGKLFLDYPDLYDVPAGTEISFDDTAVILKVEKNDGVMAYCKAITAGVLMPLKKAHFKNYKPNLPFLTEKDKKDILWGLQVGVNILVVSYTKNENNILELRDFLYQHNGKDVKIIAKIETKESIENLEQIINAADGISLQKGILETLTAKKSLTEEKVISMCNTFGKPFILAAHFSKKLKTGKNAVAHQATYDAIEDYIHAGVDAFMLGQETAFGDEPIDDITGLYNAIIKYQAGLNTNFAMKDVHIRTENEITDYLIYNAYRTSKELDIKAIICFTHNGYSVSRLSTLKPSIPVIAFTKVDDTYKYLNLLRAVK
ncbi:MAG: pyruvate kinase [bacterium]